MLDEHNNIVGLFQRDIIISIIRQPQEVKHEPPTSPRQIDKPIEEPERHDKYELRKNKDTSAFEVHMKSSNSATASEPVSNDESDIKNIQMVYKGSKIKGIYEPSSKNVIIEKGTLVVKHSQKSLDNSPSHAGVRRRRSILLRKQVEEHNSNYYITTEDTSYTSLSQAACVITGAIINPSDY